MGAKNKTIYIAPKARNTKYGVPIFAIIIGGAITQNEHAIQFIIVAIGTNVVGNI